jgi:hypothetical protein
MPKLTLDDNELRAVQDLLTEVERESKPFLLSPKRLAHQTVLEKIQDVLEEKRWTKRRRPKDFA